MSGTTEVTEGLEPLRSMLAADGYALAAGLSADGRTVVLDISATADACAECLAPATVIASVARSCLSDVSALAGREIDVRLPIRADATDSAATARHG